MLGAGSRPTPLHHQCEGRPPLQHSALACRARVRLISGIANGLPRLPLARYPIYEIRVVCHRCLTSLAGDWLARPGSCCIRPHDSGGGRTIRSSRSERRMVEGASDSTLRCRRRRSVESRAPPTAQERGPPSPLSRGGTETTPPAPLSAGGGRRGSSGRRRRRWRRSSGKIRYAACGSRNCRCSRRGSRR